MAVGEEEGEEAVSARVTEGVVCKKRPERRKTVNMEKWESFFIKVCQ